MDNPIVKWVVAHGHKVLIWIQFFIAVILWITADPNPGELMKDAAGLLAGWKLEHSFTAEKDETPLRTSGVSHGAVRHGNVKKAF